MSDLGSALHGFFAADRPGLEPTVRRAMAEALLRRWHVQSALSPDDVVVAGDALRAWTEATYPGAIWRREWPVLHRLSSGTVLRGRIDLLLETSRGLVIIDHKTYPGHLDDAIERARGHAGQLLAYATAATAASGAATIDVLVHLTTLGQVVRLAIDDRSPSIRA
jgi:ATP-dependent exoDNAse (exonuclease V) beta subunit